MRHIKKFESFTDDMINENIFQDAYNKVKSKIVAWKDNKIKEYFNQGINIFQKTKDTPEVKNIIEKIKELPEDEKNKLKSFVDDPNGLYNSLVSNQESITESLSFDIVKRFLGKVIGSGIFLGSIANLIFAVVTANFPTSGSSYHFTTSGTGIAWGTVILIFGFIVGGMIYIASMTDSEVRNIK